MFFSCFVKFCNFSAVFRAKFRAPQSWQNSNLRAVYYLYLTYIDVLQYIFVGAAEDFANLHARRTDICVGSVRRKKTIFPTAERLDNAVGMGIIETRGRCDKRSALSW